VRDRELYSIEEAREILGGIARNTIYELMRNGDLASVQVGRRRFISAIAIAAFIATSTTTERPSRGAASRPPRAVQMRLHLVPPPPMRSRRREQSR